MHSSQNEKSNAFLQNVFGRTRYSTAESRASLKEHQLAYQRNPNMYGNQKYLDKMQQNAHDNNHADYMNFLQTQASHGGGDYSHQATYSKKNNYYRNEYPQHKKSQTEVMQKKSDETFSQKSCSSDRSDSTRQTALRKQSKSGRQLMDLVSSKASLHKTIEDGITGVDKRNPCACGKTAKDLNKNHYHSIPTNTEFLMRSESEEFLPCSSSKSAERINDKIIHPMVKKFRLLYLHNIKEEVGIMEDLEMLPNKLAKFCKQMEKDLPKNS